MSINKLAQMSQAMDLIKVKLGQIGHFMAE